MPDKPDNSGLNGHYAW